MAAVDNEKSAVADPKKASKKKKKRISKHILESRISKQGSKAKNKKGNGKKKQGKNTNTKDPIEAAAYLTTWKHHNDDNANEWKFNKNHQSWLIRHMYRGDRLNKVTFALMVEYLRSAANGTKERVREDAMRRAIRYKEWHKTNSEGDDENGDENEELDNADEEKNLSKEERGDEDDEEHWLKLNSHDKRKEYKRARKILDSVTLEQENAGKSDTESL